MSDDSQSGEVCAFVIVNVGLVDWDEIKNHYLGCENCQKVTEQLFENSKETPGLLFNLPEGLEDPLEFLRMFQMLRQRDNDLNDSYLETLIERAKPQVYLLQDFIATLSECLTLKRISRNYRLNAFERLVRSLIKLIKVVGPEEVLVLLDREYIEAKIVGKDVDVEERLNALVVRWGWDLGGNSKEEIEDIMNKASAND